MFNDNRISIHDFSKMKSICYDEHFKYNNNIAHHTLGLG